MNVLLLSPGYPAEMPEFARGLAEVGATVIGVGDQPAERLPERARRALAAYLRVHSLFDEARCVEELRRELGGRTGDWNRAVHAGGCARGHRTCDHAARRPPRSDVDQQGHEQLV